MRTIVAINALLAFITSTHAIAADTATCDIIDVGPEYGNTKDITYHIQVGRPYVENCPNVRDTVMYYTGDLQAQGMTSWVCNNATDGNTDITVGIYKDRAVFLKLTFGLQTVYPMVPFLEKQYCRDTGLND